MQNSLSIPNEDNWTPAPFWLPGVIIVALAIVALWLVARRVSRQPGAWVRSYRVLPVTLIDGTRTRLSDGPGLMKQWDGKAWQYRRETEDEAGQRLDDWVW